MINKFVKNLKLFYNNNMIKKIKTFEPYNDNSYMLCWLYSGLNYYRTYYLNKNKDNLFVDIMSLIKTSINYLKKNKKLYELKNLCLDFITFKKIIKYFNSNFVNGLNFYEEFELILDNIEDFLLFNKPICFIENNDKIDFEFKGFFDKTSLIFNKNIYTKKDAKDFDVIANKIVNIIFKEEPLIICFDNSFKFNNNYYKLAKEINKKVIRNLYKNSLNCCTHMALIVGVELRDNKLKNVIVQDNFGTKFENGNYKISYEYLQTFCHYIVFQEE